MVKDARRRAREQGVPFDLVLTDIVIPIRCPVLGLRLRKNEGRAGHNSPSLDRLIPSRGYVSDNIVVVSQRVNTLKRDATLAELQAMVRFYKRKLKK